MRLPLARLLPAACLALVLGHPAAPALAQWDDEPVYYPRRWERRMMPDPDFRPYPPRPMRPAGIYPLDDRDDLSAASVVRMLRGRGFRDVAPPRRQGPVYVVDATDPGERRVRLLVDSFRGFVVRRDVLGPAIASLTPPQARPESARAPAANAPDRRRQAGRAEPRARDVQAPGSPAPLPPQRPEASAPPPEAPQQAAAPAEPAPPPEPPQGWVTPPALSEAGLADGAARRVRTIEGPTPVPSRPDGDGAPPRP